MGQEEKKKISDIIRNLRNDHGEIIQILVIDKDWHLRSSERDQPSNEDAFSENISSAMQMIKNAIGNETGFGGFKIKSKNQYSL